MVVFDLRLADRFAVLLLFGALCVFDVFASCLLFRWFIALWAFTWFDLCLFDCLVWFAFFSLWFAIIVVDLGFL